jgi:hypothetical protein
MAIYSHPRLTIGIPTYDRPHLLGRAIASALAQQRPARVLVADQTGAAAEAVRPWLANPLVHYLRTDATGLWDNWCRTAEGCTTELFSWLQDDDEVYSSFAARVEWAFDHMPGAGVYLGRVAVDNGDGLGNWWHCCGPLLPMDLKRGLASRASGKVVSAAGYFTSMALSPAVAFRWSGEACDAIRRCPAEGCDLYNERLVLAELARDCDVAVDPAIVGLWHQHHGNESKAQVRGGGRVGQFALFASRLDAVLAGRPGWEDELTLWLARMGPGSIETWLKEAEDYGEASPGHGRAVAIARDILGQFRNIEPTPAKPGPDPAPTPKRKRA